MLVKNLKNINKDKLYYCYSPPLCDWLKNTKSVFPIYTDTYIKPGKYYGNEFEVYIITDTLDMYLKEWTNNKKDKVGVQNGQIEQVIIFD